LFYVSYLFNSLIAEAILSAAHRRKKPTELSANRIVILGFSQRNEKPEAKAQIEPMIQKVVSIA